MAAVGQRRRLDGRVLLHLLDVSHLDSRVLFGFLISSCWWLEEEEEEVEDGKQVPEMDVHLDDDRD